MKAFKGKNVYMSVAEDDESWLGVHMESDLTKLTVRFGRCAKTTEKHLSSPNHFDSRIKTTYVDEEHNTYRGQTLDRIHMPVFSTVVTPAEWNNAINNLGLPEKVATWVLKQAVKGQFKPVKDAKKILTSMLADLVPPMAVVWAEPKDLWHEPKVKNSTDDDTYED